MYQLTTKRGLTNEYKSTVCLDFHPGAARRGGDGSNDPGCDRSRLLIRGLMR